MISDYKIDVTCFSDRELQSFTYLFGHVRAFLLMAVKMDISILIDGSGQWFPDIMEQGRTFQLCRSFFIHVPSNLTGNLRAKLVVSTQKFFKQVKGSHGMVKHIKEMNSVLKTSPCPEKLRKYLEKKTIAGHLKKRVIRLR